MGASSALKLFTVYPAPRYKRYLFFSCVISAFESRGENVHKRWEKWKILKHNRIRRGQCKYTVGSYQVENSAPVLAQLSGDTVEGG